MLAKSAKVKQATAATRPEADPYATALSRRYPSADLVFAPMLAIEPVDEATATAAVHAAQATAVVGVVMTSAAAVAAADALPAVAKWKQSLPAWTLGYATRSAAAEAGWTLAAGDEEVPAGTASRLATAIVRAVAPGSRLAYLCGVKRRASLESGLAEAGLGVAAVEVYDAVSSADALASVTADTTGCDRLAVVFFSPRGVTAAAAVVHSLGSDGTEVVLVAIGPTTAAAIAALDLPSLPVATASEPTPAGVLAALDRLLGGHQASDGESES